MHTSSRIPCAPYALINNRPLPSSVSARKQQQQHMSDQTTSGEPTPAPAENASTTTPAASPAAFGSFGGNRGSGLARGKRPAALAAKPTASSASTGSAYKPTSVEVITPVREYQNPFASGTPMNPIIEPPAQPVESPAAPVQAVAEVAAPAPVPTPAPVVEPTPAAPSVKSEINILPPEEVKRPAQSWGDHAPQVGGDSRGRREDRGTFRPERRDAKPLEPREPRREPALEQRAPLPRDAKPAAVTKKSGGFINWLKGLFGIKSASAEAPRSQDQGENPHADHRQHRSRHQDRRGGYQGENRGPRDNQPRDPRDYPEGEQQYGERRFEGGGRRRRRGGRGRNRDDRGGPRSEGQQGGGAI